MNRLKKVISYLVIITLAASIFAASSDFFTIRTQAADIWDGSADVSWYNTKASEFTLTKPEQLYGLSLIVNGLASGIDVDTFEGKTIRLGADLYMNNDLSSYSSARTKISSSSSAYYYIRQGANDWLPIGMSILTEGDGTAGSVYKEYVFSGTFDGQGHYIYNLYTEHLADTGEEYDLFGWNAGTIRNLGVTGEINSYRYAAGIAAINDGLIEYCYTDCAVNSNGGGSFRGAGGIVGANFGTVQYCWSQSDIYNEYRAAGGIVGHNAPGANVNNCWFLGTADSASFETKGAIAGANGSTGYEANGTVDNCYYLANCSGKITSDNEYNGKSVAIGHYNSFWDQQDTCEFDKNGVLTSDSSRTLTGEMTANTTAVVAGDSYYPVLYWQKGISVPSTVNVTVKQPSAGGAIALSESGSVPWGTDISFSCTMDGGYKFTGYTVNGASIKTSYFKATEDIEISGNFKELVGATVHYSDTENVQIKVTDEFGNTVKDGDIVPEEEKIVITASLQTGAAPDNPDYEYLDQYYFKADTGSDSAKINSLSAKSVTYTMTDKNVTVTAEAAKVRKEWISLADITWFNSSASDFTLTNPQQLAGVAMLLRDGETFEGKTIRLGANINLSNTDGTGGNRVWTPIGSFPSTPENQLSLESAQYSYIPLDITSDSEFNEKKSRYGTIYRLNSASGNYYQVGNYQDSSMPWADGFYFIPRFMGTFDGQGHRINNLFFEAEDTLSFCGGLFASASAAKIKNVSVDGLITNSLTTAGSSEYFAGIVAMAYNGTVIDNCSNYVEISNNGDNSAGIAALIANTAGNSAQAVISNCINYADINANAKAAGIASAMTGLVTDCMNFGDITVNNAGAGGIVYSAEGAAKSALTVERCGNEGSITVKHDGITAAFSTAAKVGGIVGTNNGNNNDTATVVIVRNCYNRGNIDGGVGHSAGGLVGVIAYSVNSVIEYSYNTGSVTSAFIGNSTGTTNNGIGGVIGQDKVSEGSSIGTGCYNAGTISSAFSDAEAKKIYVGAVAGMAYHSYSESNINSGKNNKVDLNGYYLAGSSEKGLGMNSRSNSNDLTVSKTEPEMKSTDFVNTLGAAYKAAVTLNNGFPILTWEKDKARFDVIADSSSEHGHIVTDVSFAAGGDTVTVLPMPDFAYQIMSVGYYTDDSSSVTAVREKDGVYTFTMPEANVTVVAEFEADPMIVVTVFGKGLTMADLLAYPTAGYYTNGHGNTYWCEGIKLTDIAEHYVQVPDGTEGYVVHSDTEDDWLMTRGFRIDEFDGMMLAWVQEGVDTRASHQVRLVAGPQYGGSSWVNRVSDIYVCEHEYGEPEWNWSESEEGVFTADTATFKCGICRTVQTSPAEVTSETKAASCEEDGYIRYTASTTVKEEQYAGIKEIIHQATGHDWDEGIQQTEHECGDAAVIVYTCKNDPEHIRKEAKSAEGHTLETVHENEIPATCYAEGSFEEVVRCSKCGAEISRETRTIAAIGHEWSEWKVTKEATETAEGEEQRVCAHDSSHVETRSIPKLSPSEPTQDDKKDDEKTPDTPAQSDDKQEEPSRQEEPAAPAEEPAPQPAAPVGTMFSDVPDNSNIFKPVNWAVKNNIVKGFSDGTFKPEDSCTREQFAIMMWRFAGQPDADISAANKFSDVASFSNNTSRKAVAWAVDEGVINGFNDGHFGPQETVTRRQVVIMLWRWAGRPAAKVTANFSDVDPSESTFKAIQWGSEVGLVKGYSDGTFKPEDDCQRQHIVIFLYRYARDVQGEDVN